MKRLLFSLALTGLCGTTILAADESLQPVQELYKSSKLFEKSEYKKVRTASVAAFEKRFEPLIKDAFGDDREALTEWFAKNLEVKEEFYCAINQEKDDVLQCLTIFKDLWKYDKAAVAKYYNLAIAIAVVWDSPQQTYDYRGHQIRTKSVLPENYLKHGPVEEFRYHVTHAREIQGKEAVNRMEVLPWEFLVYVVDHRTPTDEREWALKNYLTKRPMIGKIYHEIEYDNEMLRTQSAICKLNGKDYTLSSIKKFGGVCAMQADFAARVGKSMDVPAAYVRGDGSGLERHAWVMWVEVKSASKNNVNFTLESHGRYFGDNYYTGQLKDPQTGIEILDRDMERRLGSAASDRQSKRQGELIMEVYQGLAETNSFDLKKRIAYLDNVLKLSPYNEQAWEELARIARQEKDIPAEIRTNLLKRTQNLVTLFAKYPDYSWKIAGDLLTIQTDKQVRNQLYEKLAQMYETANRPDLACEARLKWADYLSEDKRWAVTMFGISSTIKKFPDEGRYIPKLLDKMKEMTVQYPEGKKQLTTTYLDLIRRMKAVRGDTPTEYFLKTAESALTFLTTEKKTKEADELRAIIRGKGVVIRSGGAEN